MQNTSSDSEADYNGDLNFAATLEVESCAKLTVPSDMVGLRPDNIFAKLMLDYSRSCLATWIKGGPVIIDGKPARPKEKLIGGGSITVTVRSSKESPVFLPGKMDLDIVYEGNTVIVVNKSAGLAAYPATGNWSDMLFSGLPAHCSELEQIPRVGIVHWLDKGTSGLMATTKTLPAQNSSVWQLWKRTVKRIYCAVVSGTVPLDGEIEILIGRNPRNRLKMAVAKYGSRSTVTRVKVLEHYPTHSYIEYSLKAGRTHQVRARMYEANHLPVADPVYGSPRHPCSEMVKEVVRALGRQAFHTHRLSFLHPKIQKAVSLEAAIPGDMYHLLSVLRSEAGLDSPLSREEERFNKLSEENDGDWDEDDYDAEVVYTRD